MEKELKDKGIKEAVKAQPAFRLSPNFTYRTMLKVTESVRLREKKSERKMLYAIIATSILLLGGCLAEVFIYLTRHKETMPTDLFSPTEMQIPDLKAPFSIFSNMEITSVYLMFLLLLPVLLWFDHWIRKQYFKHHTKD